MPGEYLNANGTESAHAVTKPTLTSANAHNPPAVFTAKSVAKNVGLVTIITICFTWYAWKPSSFPPSKTQFTMGARIRSLKKCRTTTARSSE